MAINSDPHIHEQVICANVFIRKNGKYLVLRRSSQKKYAPGYVHPVGGKVDRDENPYIAAVREVTEETGVTIKNLRLEAVLLELQPEKGESYNWLIFHFSADYDSGEVIQTEEGELIELTAEELKQEKLFPSVKPIIADVLDPTIGTIFATVEYADDHVVKNYSRDICVVGA